jgi:hypothetical protein
VEMGEIRASEFWNWYGRQFHPGCNQGFEHQYRGNPKLFRPLRKTHCF